MSNSNEYVAHNRIWLDGVELNLIVSGDVSAAEDAIVAAIELGKEWIAFPYAGGSYHLRLTPHSSVVVSYID